MLSLFVLRNVIFETLTGSPLHLATPLIPLDSNSPL